MDNWTDHTALNPLENDNYQAYVTSSNWIEAPYIQLEGMISHDLSLK